MMLLKEENIAMNFKILSWNIVTEQVRNNYTTGITKKSMKMDNECICVTANKY
jgi:hypothetical protein